MNINKEFKALERSSRNGYETTVSMMGGSNGYHWSLIRYPVDIRNTEPTTEPVTFRSLHKRDETYWPRALADVAEYLAAHPDDGFAY